MSPKKSWTTGQLVGFSAGSAGAMAAVAPIIAAFFGPDGAPASAADAIVNWFTRIGAYVILAAGTFGWVFYHMIRAKDQTIERLIIDNKELRETLRETQDSDLKRLGKSVEKLSRSTHPHGGTNSRKS